ncbi:unnamed protein product [Trifolium pratense]|nr:unnamed protein product [Trifolium pratense]CAJ2643954.1 unnamed protein product [Trifolium pratense]CAJ2643955.1 unnamed protein product [Trifolium pratense]
MAKTLKLVSAIILVVFLFYIVEEVASIEEKESYIHSRSNAKCISPKDCLHVAIQVPIQSSMFIVVCEDGFCQVYEKMGFSD